MKQNIIGIILSIILAIIGYVILIQNKEVMLWVIIGLYVMFYAIQKLWEEIK